MSDINPNVPVTEAGPPEVNPGEGALSFDDLDAALSAKSSSKQAKESAAKESKSESKSKEKIQEAPDAKDDKKSESKKAGEKKDDKEVEAAPRKTIKAKHQDKELELDEEATFTVKVNGQDVEVPAKDLFSNYSGKVAWDKKFTELSKKELTFKKDSESLGKDKHLIKEIFSEKSPEVRLFKMAELAGVSPLEFRQAYYDENIKLLEQYSNMTEDERRASDLEFENKYLKYQKETSDREISSKQSQAELDQKINQLLATHEIEKGEFVDYYDKVAALAQQDGTLRLLRQGREVTEKITPELISELISKDRLWNAAETTFGKLKLDWNKDVLSKKLFELVEDAYSHGLKAADIPDVIDQIYGSKKSARVVSEKIKEKEAFRSSSEKVIPPKAPVSEPWAFDEI